MILTLKNADKKIAQLNSQGHDVYWDNYTIVSFRANANAVYNKHGVHRAGQFGYEKRFEVNERGEWLVYGFNKK